MVNHNIGALPSIIDRSEKAVNYIDLTRGQPMVDPAIMFKQYGLMDLQNSLTLAIDGPNSFVINAHKMGDTQHTAGK